jgi:hypothetical protein
VQRSRKYESIHPHPQLLEEEEEEEEEGRSI